MGYYVRSNALAFVSLCLSLFAASCCDGKPAPPYNLQCDHNMVGLSQDQLAHGRVKHHRFATENPNPLLSWSVRHTERGAYQKSFRVQVSTNANHLQLAQSTFADGVAIVWDTSIINGTQQEITYNGKPLVRDEVYYWRVVWWDHNGYSAESSETGHFLAVVGIDWDGVSWITQPTGGQPNSNAFRFVKGVNLPTDMVAKAMFYISGLGYYRAFINGQDLHTLTDPPIFLAPGWTNYEVRVGYMAFDVTELVKANLNPTIVVELGAGWRDKSEFPPRDTLPGDKNDTAERALRAQLFIGFVTGSRTPPITVKTDATWEVQASKVSQSSVYNGEVYNAQTANSKVGMASVVTGPAGVMYLANIPPISQTMYDTPIQITRLSGTASQTQVVDFGYNFAGVININVTELKNGQSFTIQHAEVLMHPPYGTQDGSLYVANLRGAKQLDTYTSDGMEQIYQPNFTYHGFRYVAVTNYPRTLTTTDLKRVRITTNVKPNSKFNSSTTLFNTIQANVVRGHASNMMTVQTDCDQRDERLGWMGDAGLSADSMAMNFHLESYLPHRVMIMKDEQINGAIPDVTPFYHGGRRPSDPSWGAAYPQSVWVLMKQYGDMNTTRMYLPSLMEYLKFVQSTIPASGIGGLSGPYGDWVPPPPNKKIPNTFPSAFSLLSNIQQVSEMAKALNESETSNNLTVLFYELAAQFNKAFLDSKTATYVDDLQISYALPLYLNIVPEDFIKNITTKFINKFAEDKYHITAGIIGTKYILPVLTNLSQNDAALKCLNLIDYPSFGYMVHSKYEPATTIWELWNGDTAGPGMNSRNHHMFSSVSGWMQTDMIGFQQIEGTYGYREMDLNPASCLDLSAASIELEYPKPIKYWWRRNGGLQCGKAAEDRSSRNPGLPKHDGLEIKCGEDDVITKVVFASYGNPEGVCGYHRYGDCHATNSVEVVEKMCLNKPECMVQTDGDFWGDPCPGHVDVKWLTVAVECGRRTSSVGNEVISNQRYSSLNVGVSIPIQSTAHLNIPAYGLDSLKVWDGNTLVYSGNKLLATDSTARNGIQSASWIPERDVLRLDLISGDYSFTVKGQPPNETRTVIINGGGAAVTMDTDSPPSHGLLECSNMGNVISRIDWVSYGDPIMDGYGNPSLGRYHSHASRMIVENACLGKRKCTIPMDKDLFFAGSRHQFIKSSQEWSFIAKYSCNARY